MQRVKAQQGNQPLWHNPNVQSPEQSLKGKWGWLLPLILVALMLMGPVMGIVLSLFVRVVGG